MTVVDREVLIDPGEWRVFREGIAASLCELTMLNLSEVSFSKSLSGELTGENSMKMNDDRMFSTRFQGWKEGKPHWCIDLELAANVSAWFQLHLESNEENFARFCLNNLKNNFSMISEKHLSAFLENVGYQAAKKVSDNLLFFQNKNINFPLDNSLEEIFQIAWLYAANPIEFFRNFEEDNFSIIGYTYSKMKGLVKDEVFGNKYPAIKYSKYGLLRKLGGRKRKEALEREGYRDPYKELEYSNPSLSNFLLAWECFYQICTPSRQEGGIKPTTKHWQEIALQYNKLRKLLPPGITCQTVDEQTIRNWIEEICIPAARNYLEPRTIYIDASNQETDATAIDPPTPFSSPDELLEQREINEIVKQLITEFKFSEWLKKLKAKNQAVILLRYGLKLKQIEVAEELGWYDKNNNPVNWKVSRNEDKVILELGKEILNWSKQHIPKMKQNEGKKEEWIEINPQVVLNSEWLRDMEIKPSFEALLSRDCSLLVKSFFDAALSTVDPTGRECLRLHYGERRDEAAIALDLQLPELDVKNRLADSQQNLQQYVINQIQTLLNINLQASGHAATKISSLLEDFLETAQY